MEFKKVDMERKRIEKEKEVMNGEEKELRVKIAAIEDEAKAAEAEKEKKVALFEKELKEIEETRNSCIEALKKLEEANQAKETALKVILPPFFILLVQLMISGKILLRTNCELNFTFSSPLSTCIFYSTFQKIRF